MNQIACKVGPALAAGCTMVLKPSEVAPLSAPSLRPDHARGWRAGRRVQPGQWRRADGRRRPSPPIRMSTWCRSPARPAPASRSRGPPPTPSSASRRNSAESRRTSSWRMRISPTRRHARRHASCFNNSGQSCNAPTRMLVPADRQDEVIDDRAQDCGSRRSGGRSPSAETNSGPSSARCSSTRSRRSSKPASPKERDLVAGGPGRPEDLNRGYYIRPTVFADVRNDMTIAREEIFGPVLSILPYESEEEAIAIANDTAYGLSSYVHVGQHRSGAQRRAPDPRRQWCISTAPPATSRALSAATSNPATDASGASSASKTFSKSNRCSAIRPLEPRLLQKRWRAVSRHRFG